jgi:SAM-dependent methyltransferase
MRISYRSRSVKDYWVNRWEKIPVDDNLNNQDVYPLKYSEMMIKNHDGRILEAGVGAGRLLRYYHQRGHDVEGIDFIEIAIKKLKAADQSLKVSVADIADLHYKNETFDYVLAFGLCHNLETSLDKAVQETFRVLKRGGRVCASFRADNLHTRLIDWLAERNSLNGAKEFHKMNFKPRECENLLRQAGFQIEMIDAVENMPISYKFKLFRAKSHKIFNENKARAEGYRLSFLGYALQRALMRIMPNQFCNLYTVIAKKL